MIKINTKLIIIEGLPGFGKTTTAKITKQILDEYEIENELYLEGNLDHPADFDKVAHYNIKEYKKLLNDNPKYKSFIKKITKKDDEDFYIDYQKQKLKYQDEFPNELYKIISKNDIYELPFKRNKRLIVDNWNKFSKKALDNNKLYIFECCFIQNPVTISLIRDNNDFENTYNYIEELLKNIKDLNPILIYIDQANLDKTFKKVAKERPKKWLDFFIEYYTEQGYGLKNNLTGLEGTLEVLKKRYNYEKEIFKMLNMKKYLLNNTKYNEKLMENKLKEIIKTNIIN